MKRNEDEEIVEFEDCYCTFETDDAIKVCIPTSKGVCTEWIPKKFVHDNSEVWEEGQRGKLVLKEWIVIKKGLDKL